VAREQRRLAAILFADAVGSSRLMGRDEIGTVARLLEHLNRRLAPAAARRGGRVIRLKGDGGLVEFTSAVDALAAAIDFQQAMVEANRDQPADKAIVFRIGLHLGDVIVEGDDIYGDDVNVAARLETAAPPGGIVVSRAVREAVAGRLKATLQALGDLTLKNIERPIRAFRVAWSAEDWPATEVVSAPPSGMSPAPIFAVPDKPSIAVMPFQNLSDDVEQEYLVDGLVEDIITALSRISAFSVMARNSSFAYKGRAVDVRKVGEELGVRYVLEGSVRKSGGRLRITGQLNDTTTGNHIWADRYEGVLEDVFELQDRITSSVVAVIEPKVRQAEIKRAQAKSTENLTAYDLYLRAYAFFSDFREESINRALALLARAVAIDPHFSTAYGLIANCHVHRLTRGWGSVADAKERGLEAAKLAAETGRDDPRSLGWAANGIARFGGDIEEALVHIERALTLSPDSVHVRRMSGYTCFVAGKHERSIEHFKRAMQLDPMEPWAFNSYYGIAFPYYEVALAWVDKALLERPNNVGPLQLKIATLAMAGRPDQEIQEATGRLRILESEVSVAEIALRMSAFRPVDGELYVKALRLAGLPG
jgi:adenylate cyclase